MAIIASASLALLEARLSAARAGYLDNLSAGAVALQATLSAVPTSSINAITAVSITVAASSGSGTATITAVDLAKTIIIRSGISTALTTALPADEIAQYSLTDTTTVRVDYGSYIAQQLSNRIFVVEFN